MLNDAEHKVSAIFFDGIYNFILFLKEHVLGSCSEKTWDASRLLY